MTEALTREEQDRIERAVPQILQQIDPKILIQFLKSAQGNAQVNVISIGKYYAGMEEGHAKRLIVSLEDENNRLKRRLRETGDFDILEYLDVLPQPRHFVLMERIMRALVEKYEFDKDAAAFLGVSNRAFSYWKRKYNLAEGEAK